MKYLKNIFVIAVISSIAFFVQRKYIKEFPAFIHAWAQSDHYALAQGFTNNGFNFFKPETFVYNHQFPDRWMTPSEQTVTAVDFPLNNFIPALAMKVLEKKSPWIYRCYILLYSITGLFFLFKLSELAGNDFERSILVILIAASSPLFVYYQSGFLPTIPSLSNAIIGIYFYYRYAKTHTHYFFPVALFFLALAALCRTTFAIPLIAVLGFETLKLIGDRSEIKRKIIPIFIAVAAPLVYFLYNSWLRKNYGSIFLSSFMPPNSVEEISEILQTIKTRWAFTYFSKTQYLFFAGAIMAAFVFRMMRKQRWSRTNRDFFRLTLIILTGCILFFFLLMKQFPEHDYYFLDTFFLPCLLLLIQMLALVPSSENKIARIASGLSVLILSIPMLVSAHESQESRRITGTWDKTNQTILNYQDSERLLDSLQVSKDAKILALDVSAPNIPFLLMQRKGFAALSTEKELIEKAMSWNFDYAVIQNEYFLSDLHASYPGVADKLARIADNGKISICKKRNPNDKSHEYRMDFERDAAESWENIQPVSSDAVSGIRSAHLTSQQEYGVTFKSKSVPGLMQRECYLLFSSAFKVKTLNTCELVVTVNENGKNIFYHSRNLKNFLKEKKDWQTLEFTFKLPRIKNENYELGIFLWNTGKSELLVDDFGFKIF